MDWKMVVSDFAMTLLPPLLSLVAAVAAGWLYAKARKEWAEFKEANGPSAYWLEDIARLAVNAAEQSNLAGLITDRRAYAFEICEKYLAAHGYKVDADLIYAAIEAAVIRQFPHEDKPAG